MSVIDYCVRVMNIVWHSVPAYNLRSNRVWTADTQAALQAVKLARQGNDTEALRLVEPVADRWGVR